MNSSFVESCMFVNGIASGAGLLKRLGKECKWIGELFVIASCLIIGCIRV